jgi:hypothetical protein
MREQRDVFRQAAEKQVQAGEAAWDKAKDKLEQNWDAFEANVQKYVENVGDQAEQRRRTFDARVNAQAKGLAGVSR